jgi:NAD(P)-dependent dehydrogenase (short-subunit alcohol dehydrogenase family)
MSNRLAKRVAIVTGGGNGIGRVTSLALAAEGARVVVEDIGVSPDGGKAADKVVNEIKQAGGVAVANYDNVASMAGGQSIIDTATKNFGRVDILVNCAGNYIINPTLDYTEAQWDSLISVHLKGLFACTQAALREMVKNKFGRIINITSIAAWTPGLGPGPAVAYSTAKAGVLGFTKFISVEMQENGITCNAISPNAITQLFPLKEIFGAKRNGPEFVAPVIAFLATEEAKKVTGQIIWVDGGEIIVYAQPMDTSSVAQRLYKKGQWTVDELIDIIPNKIIKG